MGMASNARSLVLLLMVAGAAFGLCRPDIAAQTTINRADELRPLYATPEDIAQGKELAQSSCAACHGRDGISATPSVPNLAGQRPAYLYLELKAYQSGARANPQMTDQVRFLSDDALVEVAAYYASLDPAQPAAGTSATTYVDPVQAGKTRRRPARDATARRASANSPGRQIWPERSPSIS